MSIAANPLIAQWIGTRQGRLLIHTGKVDIGQRISTALMRIAHEELSIPPEQIDIAPVRTGHAPDEGMTSGSNSIEQSGHALRCAAATLRGRLIEMAMARFGGARGQWQVADGVLSLRGSNHRIGVLDLIAEVPDDAEIDPAAAFADTAAATSTPLMRGLSEMVRGRFQFVHDLEMPGMLHARVIRPPHARARLREIGRGAVEAMQGRGIRVIRDGSFLAVAGHGEWPVVQAAQKLAGGCEWDPGGGLPETDVFSRLNADHARRFALVEGLPVNRPIPDPPASPDFSARYERPYQMHAALAPSAALARWNGRSLTLYSHSQGIYPLRESIADSLGLAQAQVDITHVPGSGCYGHNGADDAAFEACLIAMACVDLPILLKWSRQDEHAWEPYAPAMAVELAADLSGGRITRFSAEAFSDTHRGRPRAGPGRAGPARLLANHLRDAPIGPIPASPTMVRQAGIHRNLDPVYDFPRKRLVKNLVGDLAHRTSAMRTLGAAANIFALESFIDEIAHREGADAVGFRRAHLSDPRGLDVLNELQRRMDALPALPETGGRGFAYAQYKNQMARVAVCVDIDCSERAEIRLLRALIVADAGRVIDEAGLIAQLEGGFVQAASWALYEKVTWDREGITSCDWDSYAVIGFDNVPAIDVALLDRPGEPSVGAGEASPGPAIAAIANAIFDATGLRLRRMPFTPEAILHEAARA